MFFKKEENVNTNNLKLSEFDKIWTKFCFLDETGSLSDMKDQFFTVGMIKMSQPYYLQSKILYERNKTKFYDEMKFNKLGKNNIAFAKFAIKSLFETNNVSFYSYTINKKSQYFIDNFKGDQWQAYEGITLKLLSAALSEQEILILIADHVTTPKHVRFEVSTKKRFNGMKERLALAGVCRFDSQSNDLLQVVDLLIGAITYDIKLKNEIVFGSRYKIELVDFIKETLSIKDFDTGVKVRGFNIFVDHSKILDK